MEDSGVYLEKKYLSFIEKISKKIIYFLFYINGLNADDRCNDKVIIVLKTLIILLETCSESVMNNNDLFKGLVEGLCLFNKIKVNEIRIYISECWLVILRKREDIIIELFEKIFNFFIENFLFDLYKLNFVSVDFFLYILENDSKNNPKINNYIKKNFEW